MYTYTYMKQENVISNLQDICLCKCIQYQIKKSLTLLGRLCLFDAVIRLLYQCKQYLIYFTQRIYPKNETKWDASMTKTKCVLIL